MANTTNFSFKILHKDKKTKARVGQITTPHGVVDTPSFTPVGTQGTVKSVSPFELHEIGAQLIFGNTYHLHLRPGEEIVEKLGGLSEFASWGGPTITDSGGFQVFSLGRMIERRGPVPGSPSHWCSSCGRPCGLRAIGSPSTRATPSLINENENVISESNFSSPQLEQPTLLDEVPDKLVKITDDSVKFRSHIDGSLHEFTPEKSIQIQHRLGADFILVFDQCPPYPSTHDEAKKSVERTHEWLVRCIEYHKKNNTKNQTLLGIVQGSTFEDLRRESAEFVAKQNTDALAIGGVAVGESKELMREALEHTMPYLPEEKYKHLLGVGEVDDIFDAIAEGIDTFDCVIPTRFGRYGIVFVGREEGDRDSRFRIDLNKTKYARDSGPVTIGCDCKVCKNYKRGYLHHLFKANELLAYRLASYHNIYFITNLVKQIRESIVEDNFSFLRSMWLL